MKKNSLKKSPLLGIVAVLLGILLIVSLAWSTGRQSTFKESTAKSTVHHQSRVARLLQGDDKVLKGTWQNELGDLIVISKKAQVKGNYQDKHLVKFEKSFSRKGDSFKNTLLTSDPDENFIFIFTPAHHKIDKSFFAEGFEDSSDSSRDRIYLTQSSISDEQMTSRTFYKVAK